jgi:predicted DNA binding CopG/RHH family protein
LATNPSEGKEEKKRVKTVLRTIRLSEELETKLEKLASEKGIAMNALVSSALTKYALWDHLTERFGFVTISKTLFKDFVDSADPEKLQELASTHRPQVMKDMMLFWFQDVNVDNFLEFLTRRGRYGLDVKVEIKREGNNLTLIVTHDFGLPYTKFLRTALDAEFRTLFKIVPTIDTTESSVMVKATLE